MADGTYTTPADEEFFAAIGRLTIAWAHLESGLDWIIMLIHHLAGGHRVEREIPWSLGRKLKYIRKCFRTLEGLKPANDAASKLMQEIKEAAETRHDIIHGFIVEHPEGSGEAKMMRLLRDADPLAHKRFTVTTTAILEHGSAAQKLAGQVLTIANGMQGSVRSLIEEMNKP